MRRSPIALAVTLASLLGTRTASAQIVCTLGGGSSYVPLYDQPPTIYAAGEFNRILSLLCGDDCGLVTEVQNVTVANAMTMTISPGVSKIAYNPGFMGQVFNQFGAGASFGVIAHEIGHHLDLQSASSWMDSSWSRELRADAWAGCALAKASIPSAQLKSALQAIAAYPSPSHPAWDRRLPAIERGFKRCGGTAAAGLGGGDDDEPETKAWTFRYRRHSWDDYTTSSAYRTEDDCRRAYEAKNDAGYMTRMCSRTDSATDDEDEQEVELDDDFDSEPVRASTGDFCCTPAGGCPMYTPGMINGPCTCFSSFGPIAGRVCAP
jgi:hypothetical protein